MEDTNNQDSLGTYQRFILILITFLLFITLIFLRLSFNSRAPLDQLVKNSIELNQAFSNNKPTVLEFYADWCESCKSMAPNMLSTEKKYQDMINIVMLNVDNIASQELIQKYNVKGIPQLNFFDKFGVIKDQEIGLRNADQLDKLFDGILRNKELSEISNNLELTNLESQSSISSYPKQTMNDIKPRTHG